MAVQSIRDEFHTELASTILYDVQRMTSYYYYFLGKTNTWGNGDVPPTNIELDSVSENTNIRSNALYFQRIGHNDVSIVTKRYDWESGIVFPTWDHTKDLSDSAFYVMTDEYHVYKCLDNSNGGISTVKPTGTSYSHIRSSDGYTWKYMYTIPPFKRSKFLSLASIPVQKALTDSFYDQGSVETVAVTNGGSGYIDSLLTYITVSGGGVSGSGASLQLVVSPLTGTITSVTVINGGSGYTAGAKIHLSSTYGTGAQLTPNITGGVITSITVVSGGYGYQSSDTVTAVVGGAILIPSISRQTGEIVSVKIVNGGAGYTTTPTLTLSVLAGQTPGTGKYNSNPSAILQAVISNGEIVRVVIVDPGQNYPVDTATTITVSGDGHDAEFTPVISNGEIVDVIVENTGTGYTYIDLMVVGAGSGAILKAITATSDYLSDQTVVEQTSIPGAIYSVKIVNGGTNYSQLTTCTISGDGSGATATPVIIEGKIHNVVITSIGSNYSYATITFNDPNRITAPVGSVDASAYVILPPRKGHGYNAVDELGGNTISFVSLMKLGNGLEKLTTEQEYRQYGIIKSPTFINSGKLFRSNSQIVAYTVKLTSVGGLVEDEILIGNGVKYRVISIDPLTNSVMLQKISSSNISIGGLVAESDINRTYSILEIVSSPSLDKYSGRLLYISDEAPFILSSDQHLKLKTFIKI